MIDTKDIHTFSFSVSEKISSKYILEFFKTSLKDEDITIDKNSYIYYKYLEDSKTYELILIQMDDKNTILEPFIFSSFYENKKTDTKDVFITDNYFCVYINGEFTILKNISDVSKDDIELYINQSYKIDIDNIYFISSEKLNELKTTYKNSKEKVELIKLSNDNSFKIFQSFVIVCIISFLIVVFIKEDMGQNNDLKKYKDQYLKLKLIANKHDPRVSKRLEKLFIRLEKQNIKLHDLKYENKKLQLLLSHEKRDNLLEFLDSCENEKNVNYITFKDKDFFMEIVILN